MRSKHLEAQVNAFENSVRTATQHLHHVSANLHFLRHELEQHFEQEALDRCQRELSFLAGIQGAIYLRLIEYQKLAPREAPAGSKVKP
jgi:hypothetical protein